MVRRHEPDDQAAGLRRLLGDQNTLRTLGLFGPDAELNAVAGANLAFALNHRGGNVCLIDEAPGPRNIAGQFGLSPRHNLAEVLRGGLSLDDALTQAPGDLQLLDAEQGFAQVAETDERTWNRLSDDFVRHDWEWLVLAAPPDERPSLALAAPLRLLVLPTVKSRLTEAYAILKAAHRRQPDARWLVLFMNAGDDNKVDQLNAALNETARHFLDIDLGLLGALPKDEQLDMASRALRPVLELAPAAPAAQAIRALADRLHDASGLSAQPDARMFWQRMGLFSRLNQPPRYQNRHAQHRRAYG
jgi:flagellar biosynthesis protein FlhG